MEDVDLLEQQLLVLAENVRRQIVAQELDGVVLALLLGQLHLTEGPLSERPQNTIPAVRSSAFSLHSN